MFKSNYQGAANKLYQSHNFSNLPSLKTEPNFLYLSKRILLNNQPWNVQKIVKQ